MRHPHKEHVGARHRGVRAELAANGRRRFQVDQAADRRCTALPVYRDGNAPADSDLPDRLLFEGTHSGSGRVADWDEAAGLARVAEVILAGGLDRRQRRRRDRASCSPWGVDVSSGVERARGEKDPEKIREFVARVRAIGGVMMDANEREALLAALLDGAVARQERPLRPVRRALRARDTDAGDRAAHARRRAHPAVGGVPGSARARAASAGSAGRPR